MRCAAGRGASLPQRRSARAGVTLVIVRDVPLAVELFVSLVENERDPFQDVPAGRHRHGQPDAREDDKKADTDPEQGDLVKAREHVGAHSL